MKYVQNNIKFIGLIAISLLLYTCRQTTVYKKFKTENSKNAETKLSLDTFSMIPQEIDGCSCYFSKDSNQFRNHLYIYVNDFAQTSFLKINGVMVKFKQLNFKDIDEKTSEAKAVSRDYELIIRVLYRQQSGEETALQTGEIILTDKKGNKITRTFYGACGC